MLNTKNGNKVTVEISTYPTKINGERVVLGIARDIYKHIELERKIKIVNQSLEEKVKNRTNELTNLNLKLEEELKNREVIEKNLIYSVNRYENLFNTDFHSPYNRH